MTQNLKKEIISDTIPDLTILEIDPKDYALNGVLANLENGFILFSNPKECIVEIHQNKRLIAKKRFQTFLLYDHVLPERLIKKLIQIGLNGYIDETIGLKTILHKIRLISKTSSKDINTNDISTNKITDLNKDTAPEQPTIVNKGKDLISKHLKGNIEKPCDQLSKSLKGNTKTSESIDRNIRGKTLSSSVKSSHLKGKINETSNISTDLIGESGHHTSKTSSRSKGATNLSNSKSKQKSGRYPANKKKIAPQIKNNPLNSFIFGKNETKNIIDKDNPILINNMSANSDKNANNSVIQLFSLEKPNQAKFLNKKNKKKQTNSFLTLLYGEMPSPPSKLTSQHSEGQGTYGRIYFNLKEILKAG